MNTWLKNRFKDAQHGRQTVVVSSSIVGGIGCLMIVWGLALAMHAGLIAFR